MIALSGDKQRACAEPGAEPRLHLPALSAAAAGSGGPARGTPGAVGPSSPVLEGLGGLGSSRTELQHRSLSRPWAKLSTGWPWARDLSPSLRARCGSPHGGQRALLLPVCDWGFQVEFSSWLGKQKVMAVPQGQAALQTPRTQRLPWARRPQRGLSHSRRPTTETIPWQSRAGANHSPQGKRRL